LDFILSEVPQNDSANLEQQLMKINIPDRMLHADILMQNVNHEIVEEQVVVKLNMQSNEVVVLALSWTLCWEILHTAQEDQVHNFKWLAGCLLGANLGSVLHEFSQLARRNNRKDGE
jgi:hypothetical protein